MAHPYAQAALTGTAAVCRCFRLTRSDGVVFGFTDHDEQVSFDGTGFAPETALDASDTAAKLGLAPDEFEATGALSADAITEADISAGRYDGAVVEAWDVDWRDPADRVLLGRYTLGQIERGPLAFTAELRSRAAILDARQGRVVSTLCDVKRLGDSRCKLDMAPWTEAGTVVAVEGHRVTFSGPALDGSTFDRGTLDWTTGGNAGTSLDIRAAQQTTAGLVVDLWALPGATIAAGDVAQIFAGCARTVEHCRNTFGNVRNFRGFPHIPGEGLATEYAVPGDPDLSGGSRFD